METELGPLTRGRPDRPPTMGDVLAELTALRQEQLQQHAQVLGLLNEFAATYLNAKFKFGKPTDRWARR